MLPESRKANGWKIKAEKVKADTKRGQPGGCPLSMFFFLGGPFYGVFLVLRKLVLFS